MPYHESMRDLYERLSEVGFDADFVRSRVLPDWWEDELVATPANRALAEAFISRALGIPIGQLSDPSVRLQAPFVNKARLGWKT